MKYEMASLGFRPGDAVVVTGSASGIGRATIEVAARSGLRVVGWDKDGAGLHGVIDQLRSAGADATAVVCDVSEGRDVARAWDESLEAGPVQYLVSNAGPPSSTRLSVPEGLALAAGSMATVTEDWMSRCGDQARAVVFVSSVNGNFVAGGTYHWYPAAKAAIAAYMRQVAMAKNGSPRSNAVAPGVIATPRTRGLAESDYGQAMLARNPLGRFGSADEVAAAICFLLSPAASYINGVTLPVDGGAIWVS